MCSVATSSSLAASDFVVDSVAVSSKSFFKDGRKISIGDCALFKPPQDSPAFIGIIRRLISEEEQTLRLFVNWLYRPADVKLGKGALVEAAPNEVFYSFHKDEILAASLLHPCKVAFLRKGVELPSNTSSFVCRRVYDVENKCLWWLTDQDYINERQEEVDQLLQKTRNDMYGSVQSPKSLNGTTGNNQQPRSISENAKNISSHLPSQIKIKKRERVEQSCSDPVKRECLSLPRADDTDLGHTLKMEINKISNSGGLVNFEGVEKFVQLMQNGSLEKKLDWPCKTMLIDVLAVTDKFDCLGFFVQLKGLPVLDEWIQEIHKGKIGDGNNNIPKESDKAIDDFLLNLLHALDKLPVNLHALQTCNIGKSVNQLRAHKNVEIQKKARSLVDTWKKRVEAEMNVLDTKSGSSHGNSWQGSPMGNRRSVGQPEVSGKVSSAQSSGKLPCAKFGAGEIVAKVIATSPNSSKPIATNVKDPISVTGSDPLSTIKEEKCSSSSHSHNNSQSCSSDHSHKISVSGSRHRKSSYNFQGSALSGAQKETNSGKSSLNKNFGSEKVCDGNNQRLIVRLPNTGRSPARSSTVGPNENSPSAKSAKSDQRDRKSLEKNDSLRYNTVSKGDKDDKNSILRSDEEKAFSNDKKQCEEREKVIESPSGYKAREGNLFNASFKSMNALVESCVKFSEASVSASGGDDIGMNLLASVAAGEISRSDGSDSVSRERNLPVPEESCSGNDVNSRHRDEDTARSEDKANPVDLLVKVESSHDAIRSIVDFSADNKVGISSLDAVTDHNVKVEGVGEFHDQRITDGHISENCKKAKNMEESALKLAGVATTTESVMKEDKRDSPSLSSTELCPEKTCDVLNEQKLINNSVSVVKSESEQEKTTDTNAVSQIVEREKQNDNIPSTIADQSKDLVKSDGKSLGNCPDKSSNEEPTTATMHQTEVKMNGEKDVVKLDFDLNEGFDIDDNYEEPIGKSPVQENKPPLPISSLSGSFPASVTVASAVKGPFYPSENSFRGKGELGWKGSAATSAFRPAEPRKTQVRPQLDFDLNVTDERDLEGESHGSGFDLDLNIVDESHNKAPKMGLFNKPSLSELSSSRDFDLNSGPGADDVPLERETRVKSNVPFISPLAGVRMTGPDQASLSSWFPQSNSYPPVAITPILQNREQGYPVSGSQRIMGHPGGITSFVPEFYRGQVLSSSPAIPFPNNVPFQYPFPFETNFSMPTHSYPNTSTAYSSMPSSQYPRAYMMNIPGGGVNNVGGDSRRWVGQSLDLNSGPGSVERERGDERVSSSLRHVPVVPGSQTFSADEQMRMYQMAGGSLKRKEPDGGTNYKQLPPW